MMDLYKSLAKTLYGVRGTRLQKKKKEKKKLPENAVP